jgi:dihydrodipicolinate synthase/N-acetylneuraminate lyase
MNTMLLEGLHIPLTTPFHPDGRLNLRKLAANVERYSRTPAAGLIALGPSGEPTLLSDEETRDGLRAVAESAAAEKVLIAGISRDSVHATLALTQVAAELRYDAVLVGKPSVLASFGIDRPQPETRPNEVLTYFQTIADRSPLPLVLLSARDRALSIDTIAELAAHANIIAVLDTQPHNARSGTFKQLLTLTAAVKHEVTVTSVFAPVTARMQRAAAASTLVSTASLAGTATAVADPSSGTLHTRTKTVGFQVLAGDTEGMLDGLHAGAAGIAPAFATCAPQACYEVFAAWKDTDRSLAEEKQSRLDEAAYFAEEILGPGGLKFGCDLNGYFGGPPRLPHLPPDSEQRATLERLMKELRN